MIGWRVEVHSSRAYLMSGRSCSLARRVFFEAIANADEPPRKRGGIDLLAGGGGESAAGSGMVMSAFSATFSKRNARWGSSLAWRRPPLGLGARLPPHTKGLHQVDDKGNRHPEVRPSRAARMTFIGVTKNPPTQIKRIRLRHRQLTSSRKRIASPTKILLIQAESPAL
jgi:hypothetical protein